MHRLRALGFLARILSGRGVRPGTPHPFRLADEVVPADVYHPARGSPWATVLFVHGLSLRAHRDPRVARACGALAGAGLQVVAPAVVGLCDLRVDPRTPARIAELVRASAADDALGRPERVGVVAASFAAGLALKPRHGRRSRRGSRGCCSSARTSTHVRSCRTC